MTVGDELLGEGEGLYGSIICTMMLQARDDIGRFTTIAR